MFVKGPMSSVPLWDPGSSFDLAPQLRLFFRFQGPQRARNGQMLETQTCQRAQPGQPWSQVILDHPVISSGDHWLDELHAKHPRNPR